MAGERKIAALIAAIYEAGADFSRWPDALRLIAQAYHAPAVVLARIGRKASDFWHMAPDVDPLQMERYASHYHRINPLWRVVLPTTPGTVLTDTMMISRREFEQTEFFNDFLVPQDFGSMLGTIVHAERERRTYVVVQRRREFDVADIGLQQQLAPHLQRAVELNARLAQLDIRCEGSADALDRLGQGAFLVDAASHVIHVNREAERLTEAEVASG